MGLGLLPILPKMVYHDVFYGVFKKPAIPDLVENYFHKDAEKF